MNKKIPQTCQRGTKKNYHLNIWACKWERIVNETFKERIGENTFKIDIGEK